MSEQMPSRMYGKIDISPAPAPDIWAELEAESAQLRRDLEELDRIATRLEELARAIARWR